jgi:hypothetical protein
MLSKELMKQRLCIIIAGLTLLIGCGAAPEATAPTAAIAPPATQAPTVALAPTAALTSTPEPTDAPSTSPCQGDPDPASAPNAPVRIVEVVKDTTPEIVRLENVSASAVDMTDWNMCSIRDNQEHDDIDGVLAPGEVRDFPYTGSGAIWDDSRQNDGALYNDEGQLISYWHDSDAP